jgi:chaperonin GroES
MNMIGTRACRVLKQQRNLLLFIYIGGTVNIRPLHDRVVVKREPEERKSPGGIVIPDTASEKPTFGKVLAVGQGKVLENGQTRAPDIKVGDRVLFGKYSGTEVKVDNEELVVMREDDVMAVVER